MSEEGQHFPNNSIFQKKSELSRLEPKWEFLPSSNFNFNFKLEDWSYSPFLQLPTQPPTHPLQPQPQPQPQPKLNLSLAQLQPQLVLLLFQHKLKGLEIA